MQRDIGEADYLASSTADINSRWVQVVTAERRCRLLEMARDEVRLGPLDKNDVGVPLYFISHAWKNSFAMLVEGIESFLENAPEETRVWIDIFSVCQHPGEEQIADVSAFKDVVKASDGGTLVVMDLDRCNPASRAWCVYE